MSAVIRSLKTVQSPQAKSATASAAKQPRARAWLGFVAREPFFQFVVLGLLIWAGVGYWSADRERYVIHLGSAERQRIAETYAQQFGQWPTPEQLKGLTDRYIREEIYWREGLALKLDQNDEIVRRRIVQKYEFLQTDLGVTNAPGEEALQGWYARNQHLYLTPEQVAFSHVYFSTDRDGEAAAKARATGVLQQLRTSDAVRAPDLGDPFPGPSDVSGLAPQEAGRLFGLSELTEKLFKLPSGQWSGPYRSGYGWHLVYLTSRTPSAAPPFSDIRLRVLSDYQDEQRRLFNARAFEQLKAKYTVRDNGERK